MSKRIIISILTPLLVLQAWGCYTEKAITKEDLSSLRNENINVVTKDGNEYDSKSNDWTVRSDTLFLNTYDYYRLVKTKHVIPFNLIESINTSRFNTGNTIILVTFSVLVATAIGILLYVSSHPIFSFND